MFVTKETDMYACRM